MNQMENFAADDAQHLPTNLEVEHGISLTGGNVEGGIRTRTLKRIFPYHGVAETTKKQEVSA